MTSDWSLFHPMVSSITNPEYFSYTPYMWMSDFTPISKSLFIPTFALKMSEPFEETYELPTESAYDYESYPLSTSYESYDRCVVISSDPETGLRHSNCERTSYGPIAPICRLVPVNCESAYWKFYHSGNPVYGYPYNY